MGHWSAGPEPPGRQRDLAFARHYSFWTSGISALLLAWALIDGGGAEALGLQLAAWPGLSALVLVEWIKVVVAKASSGHASVLTLPQYHNPIRGDPNQGPLLKRVVLRLKRVLYRVKPLKKVVHSVCVFALAWTLAVYVTVCLGAPLTSLHRETLALGGLLTSLVVLPTLLIQGPEVVHFERVFFQAGLEDSDPLTAILWTNAIGAVLGAWLGAFPIPLDWDRPWQAWPITCCLGAAAGHAIASLRSLYILRGRPLRAKTTFKSKKQR